MAFNGILSLIVTVIYVGGQTANSAFVKAECKPENVGQFGQQSLVECVVKTSEEVENPRIRVVLWEKDGTRLLAFQEETVQEPGYTFAEPSWNDKNMNVSLLIKNTTIADNGRYKCKVITDSGSSTEYTTLKVTAKYNKPTIKFVPTNDTPNGDVTVFCNSDGGYPTGQLRWFDEDNKEIRSSKMDVKQSEDRLFNLSSELSGNSSRYTCVVFNASGGKDDEATFVVPDVLRKGGQKGEKKEEVFDSTSKIVAPVLVIGSLTVGLLLALLLCRRRSIQARRHSAAPLMGDREPVSTFEDDVEEGARYQMKSDCEEASDTTQAT